VADCLADAFVALQARRPEPKRVSDQTPS
jgi:hypothetical protein